MSDNAALFPLTQPQLRIWYIEALYPRTCAHSIGGLVHIHGVVDLRVLEQAIQLFLLRNPGLRLQLKMVDGEIRQYLSMRAPAPLRTLDFRQELAPEQAAQQWLQGEFAVPFELLEQPLYDFALVRIDERSSGYYLKLHHIVADGWTIQLMTDQVSAIYQQLAAGQAVAPQPEQSYLDYLQDEQVYLRSARFLKDKSFWQRMFHELPDTFLSQSSSDLAAARSMFTIDARRTLALRQLAREKKWSLNTIFVSAMLIYLHKLQQQNDLIIGIPVFNRRSAQEKHIAGMFTSTMPFRKQIAADSTVDSFQSDVNSALITCLFHQKYPYNLLIQDLDIGQERIDRLFQVCVNYYNTRPSMAIAGHSIDNIEYFSGQQIYSLQVVIKDWMDQGTLQCMIDYKKQDYTAEHIDRLFAWLLGYIDIVLQRGATPISSIDLLLPEERSALLYDRNATAADYPRDLPIQRLFEQQAVQTPDAIALVYGEQRLTYAELNQRANQLAHGLAQRGVRRGSVVGIMARHSPALVAGIWAIIKAGGAYLPIDPDYPSARVRYMLADSQAVLLLADRSADRGLGFEGLILDLDDQGLYAGADADPPLVNQPGDLVYIIYTSGSTGQPKGIMIEHRALVNYIWWARQTYIHDADDSFALYSSIAFDLTVTSIFAPLIGGNRIVIYQESPEQFVLDRIIQDNACSVIKATPAHLALLSAAPPAASRIRCLIVGGEDFRTQIAHATWQKFSGKVRIFNEYGPTETTVGCMIYEYHAEHDTGVSVPIGRPISNTQIYLLTEGRQPAPEGVVAEIFVAGDGLARGYLNRDDLTAEAFLDNPFQPQTRMYRTGDLARYRNGAIEYLGRRDHQIKMHGYRIEIAEIESELLRHQAVRQAVVVVKAAASDQHYLAAFVQLRQRLAPVELKRFLAQTLPAFMIPTLIIELEQFPLSSNGKIDRGALALLDCGENIQDQPRPDPAVQQLLIDTLEAVLRVEGLTPETNIYFLGVDSIKAIQISSRLSALGYPIKAKDILVYPIIQELALVLGAQPQPSPSPQGACEGRVAATPMLAWFERQAFAHPDFWHQSVLLELRAPLTPAQLNTALRMLVRQHDALRLNYDGQAGAFYYNPAYLADDLAIVETVDLPADTADSELQAHYAACKAAISLTRGLLFRALLVRVGGRPGRVLLVAHHAIIDGVSWRIILEDLQSLIAAICSNQHAELPAKTASLQRWAAALQDYGRARPARELAFWQHAVAHQTSISSDFANGPDNSGPRASHTIELSEADTWLLMADANRMYATHISDLLTAALAAAVADQVQSRDITLELEAHGREALFDDIDVSRTVGWFTALFPVRLSLPGGALQELIPSVKQQLSQLPDKGIGYGTQAYVAGALPMPGPAGIRLNYLGEIDTTVNDQLFTVLMEDTGPDSHPGNRLTCAIEIVAMVYRRQLRMAFTYSGSRYRPATIQRLASAVLDQIKAVIEVCCAHAAAPGLTGSDLPLSAAELDLLFED